MSPEPEKRSDDEIRWDLHRAIYGAWDAAERVFADVPSLLAALAASRADNDRLSLELFARERENELLRGGMTDPVDVINGLAERFVAEREAARVEVSQLRAKIDAEPELVELADDDALDDLLSTMNEVGETPVIVGHDRGGRPFLAYGWAPGGDGWDCGVVEDDTHSSEFDYNDGTQRCDECGAFDRRPLTVLSYPVTVRRRKLTLPHGWKITDLSTETGHLHIALAEPLGSTPTVTQHEPHCYSGYPHFGGCDCEPLGSPEQPAGEAKSMCVTCGNYHPTANHGQCAANVAAGLHADGLNPNAPEGDN